jgi:hypothetical protein
VRVAAITVIGKETFCRLPTALNSNLLPVNAKGLVLFLSVLSWKKFLKPGIKCPKFLTSALNGPSFSWLLNKFSIYEPKKAEIIQGGA